MTGPMAARHLNSRLICGVTRRFWPLEIVERSSTAVGFEALPKRWIVERTFAWLSRFRRLARDFERHARTVAAFIHLARFAMLAAPTAKLRAT